MFWRYLSRCSLKSSMESGDSSDVSEILSDQGLDPVRSCSPPSPNNKMEDIIYEELNLRTGGNTGTLHNFNKLFAKLNSILLWFLKD